MNERASEEPPSLHDGKRFRFLPRKSKPSRGIVGIVPECRFGLSTLLTKTARDNETKMLKELKGISVSESAETATRQHFVMNCLKERRQQGQEGSRI